MSVKDSHWGLSRKDRRYDRSVVKSIKRRLKDPVEVEVPEVFGGKVMGYIRIPICGDYGLKLLSVVSDMCKKKGKPVTNENMAYAVIKCVMDEDNELRLFGGTTG